MMSSEKSTPAPTDSATPDAALAAPAAQSPQQPRRWRLVLIVVAAILVLVIAVPRMLHAMRTVSTDDAYVNSYVTFVAPRVAGQVARVLVEDNNRVKKGDVLVELDPEPYQLQVKIKEAAVKAAEADLTVANASVRGLVAQTRG